MDANQQLEFTRYDDIITVNSGEGFVKSFIDNLSDLFTNKKTDIIDLLNNAEKEELPLLRIRLFIQLVEKFPHLEKYELLTRGETQLLSKDILIIGQCIHEHKESPELSEILVSIDESSLMNESTSNASDIVSDKKCCSKKLLKRYCYKTCSLAGKDMPNMTCCCLCNNWFHNKCINKDGDEPIDNIWNCVDCRVMPLQVNSIQSDLHGMGDSLKEVILMCAKLHTE